MLIALYDVGVHVVILAHASWPSGQRLPYALMAVALTVISRA
jgi:hypothetical protein